MYNIFMGEKDRLEKTLESYNDVFADIVNVLLFNGKQEITEDSLIDAQTFSQYKADGMIREQDRDVAKYWEGNTVHLSLIGFENQTSQEDVMPMRVISYDGAEYRKQIHNKKDEWYPVLTIVLYFGTDKHWTKCKSLKQQIKIDPRIAPFINDYKPIIFELAWLTDEQINAFKSDFKLVAQYLRTLRTGKIEDWSRKKLKHIHEILNLFKVISNEDTFTQMEDFIIQTQTKEGGTKVSDFLQELRNDGRTEGIALGRTEGIALGRDEGQNSLLSLFAKLYSLGRGDDVQRATTDRAYLKKLMDEYQK